MKIGSWLHRQLTTWQTLASGQQQMMTALGLTPDTNPLTPARRTRRTCEETVQLLELFLHRECRAPTARETVRVDGDTVRIGAWLAKARNKHRSGQPPDAHARLVAALFDGELDHRGRRPGRCGLGPECRAASRAGSQHCGREARTRSGRGDRIRVFPLRMKRSGSSVSVMSGRAPQPRPRRQQGPGPHDYNLPRWRDDGALVPGPKSFVRKATEVSSGRAGIVKHLPSNVYGARRQRFHQEALYMHQMNGTPGVLPVWDIDDAHGSKPCWYAMPCAQLLEKAFGDTSTVLDVVDSVATVAQTLAALADDGTYHRDIKPANLFWYDKAPVLADFGIATFAKSPAGLTRAGEKIGPANFMAPEMRSADSRDRGERADVYSLAKTLFVLAHQSRGAPTRRTGRTASTPRSSACGPSAAATQHSLWGTSWRL